MKISQLAEEHCANWCRGNVCVGTEINLATGLQVRWRAEGSKCLLSEGKRCPYFESSVLPMEEWAWKNPSQGVAFKNVAHQYRIRLMTERKARAAIRRCPNCRENTIRPPAKFCDLCEASRTATAKRTSKRTRGSNQSKGEKQEVNAL